MKDATPYLLIDQAYFAYLGDLRWSWVENAMVHPDGSTFALTDEIALFLEGFASRKPLIHFAHLLHFLKLLKSDSYPEPALNRLHWSYVREGARIRNAGVFAAVLCTDVPELPEPVDVTSLVDTLRYRRMPLRYVVSGFETAIVPPPQPPLRPSEFEALVLQAIQAYTDEELHTWLWQGQGPVKNAGRELANQLRLPDARTLSDKLKNSLQRPRLTGSQPYVAQMASALALPTPQRRQIELPIGGYADLTTHGKPDLILPSQFALDEEDFFRRYAENELLYFQREEPLARLDRQLVVLLDQGIRTWGAVRLVLAAAVVALGQQADHQQIGFQVAATSNGGVPLDPLQVEQQQVDELLEASDLTADPGLALERVLEEPVVGLRDVVLLTHPRNLQATDVSAAALRLRRDRRLFALTLDAEGQAELHQVQRGVPVSLQRFSVDFHIHQPASVATARPLRPQGEWSGDAEPFGFPFRFLPLVGAYLDFDFASRWIIADGWQGTLCAFMVSNGGNMTHVLPRCMLNNVVASEIFNLIGVRNGFVVHGKVAGSATLTYYDFAARRIQVRCLQDEWSGELAYNPKAHEVRLSTDRLIHILALSSMKVTSYPGSAYASEPVQWHRSSPREGFLEVVSSGDEISHNKPTHPWIGLHKETGELFISVHSECYGHIPLRDSLPLLKDATLLKAQVRGGSLAIWAKPSRSQLHDIVYVFEVGKKFPDPQEIRFVSEIGPKIRPGGIFLSPDGRWLAHEVGPRSWEILDMNLSARKVLFWRQGYYPQQIDFVLGLNWLRLKTGEKQFHLIAWTGTELEMNFSDLDPLGSAIRNRQHWNDPAVPSSRRWLPEAVKYDRHRFSQAARTNLIVAGDCFGQMLLFDLDENLVAMFFAFRQQAAAWMPDGTYHGSVSLTGHPPTPGAAAKIANALRQAAAKGRSRS